jgi:hypothetical protein
MRIALARPSAWIVIGALATIALRLPYADEALTRDEGGDAYVAQALTAHGPFAYGPYFLDRPPLLLVLYRIAAGVAGTAGIRVLGLVLALALVAMVVALSYRLAGAAGAPVAAIAAAALLCSQATGVLATPSELIAAVPSCLAVLLLVDGPRQLTAQRTRLLGAGAAAASAFLIKQSFVDGMTGCLAGSLVLLTIPGDRSEARARLRTYLAGACIPVAGVAAWAAAAGRSPRELWYAVLGFRFDAASVLAFGQARRLTNFASPLAHSGLVVGLPLAVAGLLALNASRAVKTTLVVWLGAGILGVLAGGGYYPVYLIELMPAVCVGISLAVVRWRLFGVAGTAVLVALALVPTLRGAVDDSADAYAQPARALGSYVRHRALSGETAYVLYARANILYYAGLPSPFPPHWALMMRAAPHAQSQLRALLAGPARPTWVVAQDSPNAYGLDRSGKTRRLLHRFYHQVARICSVPVLLARGAQARPAPVGPSRCR